MCLDLREGGWGGCYLRLRVFLRVTSVQGIGIRCFVKTSNRFKGPKIRLGWGETDAPDRLFIKGVVLSPF